MRQRHLAGPEALQVHAALEALELRARELVELGLRQHHLEFALETLGEGFFHLH